MFSSGGHPEIQDWKTWKRDTEIAPDLELCPRETELESDFNLTGLVNGFPLRLGG